MSVLKPDIIKIRKSALNPGQGKIRSHGKKRITIHHKVATPGFSPVFTAHRQLLLEESALCIYSQTPCFQADPPQPLSGETRSMGGGPSLPALQALTDPSILSHPHEAGPRSLCFQDVKNERSVRVIDTLLPLVLVPEQDLPITSTKAIATSK